MGETFDLFANDPLSVAARRSSAFRADFLPWLHDNLAIYEEFERLALQMAKRRKHFGARCIAEVIRFNTALRETSEDAAYKLNGNFVPCMARLFALRNPAHAGLFEFREQHRKVA